MAIRDIKVDMAGGAADATIRIVYSINAGHDERTLEVKPHSTKWGVILIGDADTIEIRHGDPIAAATPISAMWKGGQEGSLYFALQKDSIYTAGDLLPCTFDYLQAKYSVEDAEKIQNWLTSLGLSLSP